MKILTSVKAAEAGRRFVDVLRLASNVADGETVTIGNEVYEFDTAAGPGAVAAGHVRVDCTAGVTPATAGAALCATINANTQLGIFARAISANEILVAMRPGVPGRRLVCATTMAGANNVWAAAAFFGGSDGFRGLQLEARAATATEIALGAMRFVFPFNPISAIVQVRTAAGAIKAWGGTTGFVADRVDLVNTGATDIAAGDVVTVIAGE